MLVCELFNMNNIKKVFSHLVLVHGFISMNFSYYYYHWYSFVQKT